METTILLKEKWRVQRELSETAGYDIAKYARLIDEIVDDVFAKVKRKKTKRKKVMQKMN